MLMVSEVVIESWSVSSCDTQEVGGGKAEGDWGGRISCIKCGGVQKY